jgi:hypothetical protein
LPFRITDFIVGLVLMFLTAVERPAMANVPLVIPVCIEAVCLVWFG